MSEIRLTVNKADVWDEVAKIAAYTGDKLPSDEGDAYERIVMTDEDAAALQRFWNEAAALANGQLKDMVISASSLNEDYSVRLRVSRLYDTALNESLQEVLRGYFVQALTGRWFRLANKAEAEDCFADALALMDDALRKLHSRKWPTLSNA